MVEAAGRDINDDLLTLEALWTDDLERSHGNPQAIVSSLGVHRAGSDLAGSRPVVGKSTANRRAICCW